jgi:hypothetical protein
MSIYAIYATRPALVGTQFSPTGRILPGTPVLARFQSLRPALQQLPKDSPLTKKLLGMDFSNLEARVLVHAYNS